MDDVIKVAGIQIHAQSGHVTRNLARGKQLGQQAADQGAELIVFPELWYSGYNLSQEQFARLGEARDGQLIKTLSRWAAAWHAVLVVPFIEKEGDKSYIAAAVIERNGDVCGIYRKSFLWGEEREKFTRGKRCYDVFQTSVGMLGVLICYDAEFPEPSRLLAMRGAELLVVPSVWSFQAERRWDIQLPARALDNTVYVLGVNTVGEHSCGKSKMVAPDGKVLKEAPRHEEDVLLADIDRSEMSRVRDAIPYLKDYDFDLVPSGESSSGA